jgi:hypothetical protein
VRWTGPVELNAASPIVFVSCGVAPICAIGANGEFFYGQAGRLPVSSLSVL